jgi:hypothetical protein
LKKTKENKPHSEREIANYMASGIEQSARECERDGYPEKAASLFAWAKELRDQDVFVDEGWDLFG